MVIFPSNSGLWTLELCFPSLDILSVSLSLFILHSHIHCISLPFLSFPFSAPILLLFHDVRDDLERTLVR